MFAKEIFEMVAWECEDFLRDGDYVMIGLLVFAREGHVDSELMII